jgi:hypothetical protein
MPNELTQRVFQTIDSMHPDIIVGMFAEDARMVFGNAEPLVGREAITVGIKGFFATINGLNHRIIHDWHFSTDTIAETEVTYRRLDDNNVTVPAVSIWHTRDDGLIDDYRIFVDLAPVYTP